MYFTGEQTAFIMMGGIALMAVIVCVYTLWADKQNALNDRKAAAK